MFLRCSYFSINLSRDVLLNMVLTQKNQCSFFDVSYFVSFVVMGLNRVFRAGRVLVVAVRVSEAAGRASRVVEKASEVYD